MLPKVKVSPTNILISLKDLLMGLIISILFWPACLLLYCINIPTRHLVQAAYNHFHPGKYQITEGEDGVFGTKIKGNCKSLIQGYQIIQGKPCVNKIREKFTEMLQTTNEDFVRFKYIFTNKFGYFCWKKDINFDIKKHIRMLDNWDLSKEADERKLLDITGSMATIDMNDDKPQWEILLIPKYRVEKGEYSQYKGQGHSGQESEHYALLTRFNHAYADAISYFLMVNHYLADSPAELPMDPTQPFKVPFWAKIVVWSKVILLGPYFFFSIMATYIIDRSVFSTPQYSSTKLYARSPLIKLETVKNIKKASGASVTAILYTALYSALHKSHLRVYPLEKIPSVLHLGSVMAMFPYWKKRKLGNQFTLWPYTAPLNVDQGLKQRLIISNQITNQGVGSPGPVFNFYLTRSLGSLPTVLHKILWSLSGCPIMLSNVPAFTTPLKLYGGQMVDGAGFIPLMSTVGVGLSTQSYCGDLRFNCVVDPKVFSRRSDLQTFLNDIINELSELAKIYNVKEAELPSKISSQISLPPLDENGNEILEKPPPPMSTIKFPNSNSQSKDDLINEEDFNNNNNWQIGKFL